MLYYLSCRCTSLVCLLLIVVILLQQGKGGDIANAFGGGSSQAAFGARAGATLLTKMTAGLAAAFILLSLMLVGVGSARPGRSSAAWRLRRLRRGPNARRRNRRTRPAPAATPTNATPQWTGAPRGTRRRSLHDRSYESL